MIQRFDKYNHWPDNDKMNSRSRCKLPKCNLVTHVFCTKCNVHLCFTKNRNCFRKYHENEEDTANRCKPKNKKQTNKEQSLQKAVNQAEATKYSIPMRQTKSRAVVHCIKPKFTQSNAIKSSAKKYDGRVQKKTSVDMANSKRGVEVQKLTFMKMLNLCQKSNR